MWSYCNNIWGESHYATVTVNVMSVIFSPFQDYVQQQKSSSNGRVSSADFRSLARISLCMNHKTLWEDRLEHLLVSNDTEFELSRSINEWWEWKKWEKESDFRRTQLIDKARGENEERRMWKSPTKRERWMEMLCEHVYGLCRTLFVCSLTRNTFPFALCFSVRVCSFALSEVKQNISRKCCSVLKVSLQQGENLTRSPRKKSFYGNR